MVFCWEDNYIASLRPPRPPTLKKEDRSVLADVLSKPASFRPLKNSLYVKTRSLGLKVHMESSGRAPGENVLRGIF